MDDDSTVVKVECRMVFPNAQQGVGHEFWRRCCEEDSFVVEKHFAMDKAGDAYVEFCEGWWVVWHVNFILVSTFVIIIHRLIEGR